LRGLLLRLMKPFAAFQHDVNAEMVSAVRHLAAQLETLRAEQLRAETERLRQAREVEMAPMAAIVRQLSPPALQPIGELTATGEPLESPDAVPQLHARTGDHELELSVKPSVESDFLVIRTFPDAGLVTTDTNGRDDAAPVP
jgi:hypothetical protein